MRKVLTAIVPFVVTVVLFLVLFNNFNHGRIILVVLIALNLGVLCVRANSRFAGIVTIHAKAGSLCCISALATLLLIESLFPLILPKDYAQIRDLTKQVVGTSAESQPGASIVFTNTDQKRQNAGLNPGGNREGTRSWHAPGRRFAYYGYDPNLKASYVNLFHWNSHGYYDHDYSLSRPEGVRRIVIIGDSYVEAVQVPLARSFHKLAEKALNTGSSFVGPQRIQVIALGNSGTGQVEHFKVLKKQAVRYNPDAVVVGLSRNDFCDDDPDLKRELVLASGSITPLIRRLAAHGYYALAFAVRRMDDLQRNRIGISPELLQWSGDDMPRVESAWDRTLDMILQSRNFCRSRGISFLLVYLGSDLEVKYAVDPQGTISKLESMGGPHATIRWDLTRSMRRVQSFCREHSIPMVSLLEPLVTAQRETGHHVFGDHYTMFGHQVAAQVLSCALHSSIGFGDRRLRTFENCTALEFRRAPTSVGAVALPAGQPTVKAVPATSQGLSGR